MPEFTSCVVCEKNWLKAKAAVHILCTAASEKAIANNEKSSLVYC